MDWLDLLALQGTLKSLLPTPQFKSINSSVLSFLYSRIFTLLNLQHLPKARAWVCFSHINKPLVFKGRHSAWWPSLVAHVVKNLPVMQEAWVPSLGWEDPLEDGMATHISILAGESMDREAWWATVHGVAKSPV